MALFRACEADDGTTIREVLAERPMAVLERNTEGANAAHIACTSNSPSALSSLLSSPSLDLCARTHPSLETPLHTAVRLRHAPCVSLLLSSSSLPDYILLQDAQGASPLHAAIASGDAAIVADLVAALASLSLAPHALAARTLTGATPLHAAALQAHLPTLELLLEAAVDAGEAVAMDLLAATTLGGATPLAMGVLAASGEAVKALLAAARAVSRRLPRRLLKMSMGNSGVNVLHLAAVGASLSVWRALLKVKGARSLLDVPSVGTGRITPIDVLNAKRRRSLLKYLSRKPRPNP